MPPDWVLWARPRSVGFPMPDWSYRTVFRPLLFRLPAGPARDLCLGVMGALARLPLGSALIDFLGHMRPSARLSRSFLGVSFPAPIGLGIGIDSRAHALSALARFGFGFLAVGPVTIEPVSSPAAVQRQPEQQALLYPDGITGPALHRLLDSLRRTASLGIPLIVRLGYHSGGTAAEATSDCRWMVEQLAAYADVFALQTPLSETKDAWS